MTRQHVIANMVSFAVIRSKAAGLRNALDALKEDIGGWLDEHPEEPELLDPSTEIRASWKDITGKDQLNVNALPVASLVWAAENGLLQGNMKMIAALGTSTPELVEIHSRISPGPGYRQLDIVPPSWARRKQLEEGAPAQPAPTPPAQPAPTPLRPANNPPVPVTQEPAAVSAEPAAVCPQHGRSRHSSKSGALFCPSKMEDGTWCPWSTAQKAS